MSPSQNSPLVVVPHGAGSDDRGLKVNLGSATAEILEEIAEDVTLVAISGTLDERFSPDRLVPHLRGTVVLDLEGIKTISSFGVRSWLDLMEHGLSQIDSLYVANCSEAVVNQMIMIAKFMGPGIVLSFSVPYACMSCASTLDFMFESQHVPVENGEFTAPPDAACAKCGGLAVFDEDPQSFFEFLLRQEEASVPPEIRRLLTERWLTSKSQVEESIHKEVDGEETSVRINRPLDESVRWKRVFDGIDGTLRIDLSGSQEQTKEGIDRFLKMALKAAEETDVHLDQAPLQLVEALAAMDDTASVHVRSLRFTAPCLPCEILRPVVETADKILEAAKAGRQPEAECRRCGVPIKLVLPTAVTDYIVRAESGGGRGPAAKKSPLLIAAGAAVLAVIALVLFLLLS